MLMAKGRAQSYVRRTISQPAAAARRRQSALRLQGGLQSTRGAEDRTSSSSSIIASSASEASPVEVGGGVGVPSRQLQLQLLTSDSHCFGSIEEESATAGGLYESLDDGRYFSSNNARILKAGAVPQSRHKGGILPPKPDGLGQSSEARSTASTGSYQELIVFSLWDDLYGIYNLVFTTFNTLLIFVPLGLLSQWQAWPTVYIFWLNFIALIPLASVLGSATEELALHTGEIVGGLLNATFGNAVEMILSVQALKTGLITVVQGALLGSILSNLLLVLGMSFFLGGISHHVQRFNAKGATCNTSLLLLSSIGITVPTVAAISAGSAQSYQILMISRVTAIVIAATYVLFLLFQLYTHVSLFTYDEEADIDEWPSMSWVASCAVLVVVTFLVAIHSEYLVDSIERVVKNYGLPRDFIGVILLPIVGNAAEHATAVTVAIKDKVDLTIGVALGSSAQIALFVVPFTVICGWFMDVPMTLAFTPQSAIVLILAILVVLGVVRDGESNWLEGVMLMAAYIVLAVTYWYSL